MECSRQVTVIIGGVVSGFEVTGIPASFVGTDANKMDLKGVLKMEGSRALEPEILDNIVPFTGQPQEMNALQQSLSEGKAIQRVQTAYTTAVAVQRPRSITKVTANVLEEAKLAGASFYYGWTVKDRATGKTNKIEGPAIDLAMCAARNYGNCAIDIEVEESQSHYTFRGVFIDLESGFTCPRLYKQRRGQDIGMKDKERGEDIVFQIGQSKAVRNAVIRALPAWLIDQAIETAKAAEITKIKPENIAIARARSFDFFRQYGVTQERIEDKMGRKMDDWTDQDIVELRGMATALKEGRITAIELFPEVEVKEKDKEPQKEKEETKEITGKQKKAKEETPARVECPNGGFVTPEFCAGCKDKVDKDGVSCPVIG